MRTREDIEMYLHRAAQPWREVAEGTWVVEDASAGREQLIVKLEDELVMFRLKVVDLSRVKDRPALFFTLLELNATDMLHGAYGIAEDAVILICTLRLENLDYSEFQGTLDDFFLAVTRHHGTIAALCEPAAPQAQTL